MKQVSSTNFLNFFTLKIQWNDSPMRRTRKVNLSKLTFRQNTEKSVFFSLIEHLCGRAECFISFNTLHFALKIVTSGSWVQVITYFLQDLLHSNNLTGRIIIVTPLIRSGMSRIDVSHQSSNPLTNTKNVDR